MKGSDILAWSVLVIGIAAAAGTAAVFLIGGLDALMFGICMTCAAVIIVLGALYLAYGTYLVFKRRDVQDTEYSSTLDDYKEIVRETNRDEEHGGGPKG